MMSQSIAHWLQLHGLEKLASIFELNEVDFETLGMLTDGDLKELGIAFGPRKKILNLLAPGAPADRVAQSPVSVQERRQVTALFCDMVGFTELSTRIDPEALHVVVRDFEAACAACVQQYEGFLLPTLGDGVVALFGFPSAHEGEVERAIRAGLEMVTAVGALEPCHGGKLRIRVGITTGIVVVAAGRQNQAVGETINLASRLQTVAQPGEVVVNETTRRLADGVFIFADLGERQVKGVREPVRAFRVERHVDMQSRFAAATTHGLSRLVGREAEIEQILQNWRSMRRTGVGHAVVLLGEAGIGKSRIVEAVCERLAPQATRTLLFQCSALTINSALYPVRDYFEHALGHFHDVGPDRKLDKLEAELVERLGLPREDMRFIARLLSIPYHERYGVISGSPKFAKDETMRVLVEMLTADAHIQPTLVLFEDAHWADPTSLDLLTRVIDRFVELPVLMIVTARPDFNPSFPSGARFSILSLARLTPSQSSALLSNVTGGRALPPALAEQIIRRTDGVPLFVEELTKTILESGDLVVENGQYAYAQHSGAIIAIPETLRDSLMARLDRVASAKGVAQIGSVIGRDFSYELIAGLEFVAEDTLESALQLLTSSGLASLTGKIPKTIYTFSHALVQDVAYDSLLKSRRESIHANVARAMEALWPQTRETTPELLARHYTLAEQYDNAVPLWLSAGKLAMRRFSMEEAIAHLHAGIEALAKLPHDRQRDELELALRTALGPALVALHGWAHEGVARALEPAWALAQALGDRSAFVPLLNTLSVHTMTNNNLSIGLEWAERLLEAGAKLGDGDLEIVGHRAASACFYWRGDFLAARAAGDSVRKLYRADQHQSLAALINTDPFTGEGIYRCQYLWMLGYPDQACAAHSAMEANARRRKHPFDLAFALTLGAQIFELLDDAEALLARADEAEQIGREYGIPLLGEVLVEISRGIAWLRMGRASAGFSQLQHGLDRLKSTGHRIWIWYLQALEAHFLAREGELDRAAAMIEESVRQVERGEDRAHYAEILRLQGVMLLLQGADADAEKSLRKAIGIAHAQQAYGWELRAGVTLARSLATKGRTVEAAALLQPIYDWFTEGFGTRDVRDARAVLDELRTVDPDARVRAEFAPHAATS